MSAQAEKLIAGSAANAWQQPKAPVKASPAITGTRTLLQHPITRLIPGMNVARGMFNTATNKLGIEPEKKAPAVAATKPGLEVSSSVIEKLGACCALGI